MFLWLFDLSQTQLMQTYILENERGSINGCEKSLINVASIFIYLLGVVIYDPNYFFYLMIFSISCVLLSAISFTFWMLYYKKI
jgi:iron-regulated transporter 1